MDDYKDKNAPPTSDSHPWYDDEEEYYDEDVTPTPLDEFDETESEDWDETKRYEVSEKEDEDSETEKDPFDAPEYENADLESANPNAFVAYLPEMCRQAGFEFTDWLKGGTQKRREITQIMVQYRDSGDPYKQQLAGDIMYELHKGFIWNFIKRRYSSYLKMHAEDLRQAGAIGFVEAFKSLNPKYMLTTYVTRFVQHHVSEYIATYINRTTTYRSSHIQQVYRAEQKLIKAGIANPGAHEIAIESGLNVVLVETALSIRASSQTRSIEEGLPIDNTAARANEFLTSPIEQLVKHEEEEALYAALAKLTEIEREVLIRRNGYKVPKSSFSDIHRDLGIPLNTVRVIQHRAERKITKMARIKRVFSERVDRAAKEKAARMKTPKSAVDNLKSQEEERKAIANANGGYLCSVNIHHSVKDTKAKTQQRQEKLMQEEKPNNHAANT